MDALLPPEMAAKAAEVGVKKASQGAATTFALAVLAGAFIAMGAVLSTTALAGAEDLPWGVARLLAGVTFSLGLVLVIVGGAELFTGNVLLVMAVASRRVSAAQVLCNWGLVYAGNLVGALATAALVYASEQYRFGEGAVGSVALSTATAKCELGFLQAVVLGTLGNALVCLAVWLTYSARSTADRILAIVGPITAFVAAGFEHSVANMYMIPVALLIKAGAPPEFWAQVGSDAASTDGLTWSACLFANLLPVTLGNLLGGGLLVGGVYWFIYLRRAPEAAAAASTDPRVP